MRFDETKLGYEEAEETTSQILFGFLYTDFSQEDKESDNIQIDAQRNKHNRDKKQWVRSEPIQTRSRTIAQSKQDEDDEDSSSEHDEQDKTQEIVGVSSNEKEESDRFKKKIRNLYGCKGKSKDNIELNLMRMKEPQNLEEVLSSSQSSEWI